MKDQKIIAEAYRVFAHEKRPSEFANDSHCADCEAIARLLETTVRDTVTHSEMNLEAWRHLSLINEQTFKHFFPALVRLALTGQGEHDCLDQFLFHASHSTHCLTFTAEQSEFMVELLDHLHQTRHADLDACNQHALAEAQRIWQIGRNAQQNAADILGKGRAPCQDAER